MTAPRKRAPRKTAAKPAAPTPDPIVGPAFVAVAEPPMNIHDCILAVMTTVGAVRKTRRNTQGDGYNFRGVDDVVNAVYPAFCNIGVTISPQCIEKHTGSVEVGQHHRSMGWAEVVMAYTLTAPDGSTDLWSAPGAAFDAGDKALSKACSVAYRTAMLQGLCLPTDSRDPDDDTYERSSGRSEPAGGQQQAGEDNQAAQADLGQARTELWRIAKGLGWTWKALANRFSADYGCDTTQSDAKTVEAFTAQILKEAEAQEDKAKQMVKDELGGKEVADEAQAGFPESTPGSERLL